MASSRANHPLHPPFFVASRNIPKDLFPRASFRLFRVVITAKYFRKSTLPSYYFSKKGFTCIHVYIYIYIQVYIYICILTSVSAAVYACTKGKVVEQFPQLLPLPHKRFLSSVDIDVRRFASSPLPSPIFFSPLPLFFLLLSFLFFFFIILIFIPRFNSDKITAPRQFSLRKYPNDSALMILIIDKYLYDIHLWIHRMMFKVI